MKKKKNIKWLNILILTIFLICAIGLIVSITNIVKWNIDRNNTKKQVEKIEKIVEVKDIIDNEKTEIIEQQVEIPEKNPYWDYIKMNMIDVNFNELKTINNKVKGWIQVNGTNINYPFVQNEDNIYYLTHSFDNSYNDAGWVFLDYRNDINHINKNTIIYAHGRIDSTMFGSLKNILSSGWLNNTNNYIVKLSTENENSLWQVFSVYRIPTTSDYLQINFINDKKYQNFLDKLINRSAYSFNTNVNSNDNILTLSTCYNDYDKVVLHAKLIKRETKNINTNS